MRPQFGHAGLARMGVALGLVGLLAVPTSGSAQTWTETRFQTGCAPGPAHPAPPPEHRETHYPALTFSAQPAQLSIDLDAGDRSPSRIEGVAGHGFNLEHALWSCPGFRGVLGADLLDTFKPALLRVDTGLLPLAPDELTADELGPPVYRSMLEADPYAPSWAMLRHLNDAHIPIVLGIWGGPAQFTDTGERRGTLLPEYYDAYVAYVATIVEYLAREQGIEVWATTIANEPDGGDGNQIPPAGLAYIAHELAPRLATLGVKLYGPDTANGEHALQYLPLLLDDPIVASNLAFVGFHQYYPSPEVGAVVDYVRAARPDLPVIVTEYTSFGFGDLDDGQEANAQTGFALDIAATVLSHYRQGVDAALYWDAVDYLQPGHDAITRWGFLRGPAEDFGRRPRWYAMEQILAYLQPGARVLVDDLRGPPTLTTLAVELADRRPVVFLVNQDFGAIELDLHLASAGSTEVSGFEITRTDRTWREASVGQVDVVGGHGRLSLPPRSVTTLFPIGLGPRPVSPS
jgi:O-glycosyl hydrolase